MDYMVDIVRVVREIVHSIEDQDGSYEQVDDIYMALKEALEGGKRDGRRA